MSTGRATVIWAITLGICLLYAASDEAHQIFVPDRSAQVTDVLIDFSGSFIGSTGAVFFKNIVAKVRTLLFRRIPS